MKALAVLVLLAGVARAAEVDPRAEVTVQLSPFECVIIHARVIAPDAKVTSEAESDAMGRISRACDFDGLEHRTADAEAKKKAPDYSGPRTPRKLARDALDALVTYLVPTKDRPVPVGQDATLRKLRAELREVLAGRDPYK